MRGVWFALVCLPACLDFGGSRFARSEFVPFMATGDTDMMMSMPLPTGPGATTMPVADTTPPTLDLTFPALHSLTDKGQMTVRGSVSSDATSLTINGSAATISAGTFSAHVLLSLGMNPLVIVAKDSVGNAVTINAQIERHPFPFSSMTAFSYDVPTRSVIFGTPVNNNTLIAFDLDDNSYRTLAVDVNVDDMPRNTLGDGFVYYGSLSWSKIPIAGGSPTALSNGGLSSQSVLSNTDVFHSFNNGKITRFAANGTGGETAVTGPTGPSNRIESMTFKPPSTILSTSSLGDIWSTPTASVTSSKIYSAAANGLAPGSIAYDASASRTLYLEKKSGKLFSIQDGSFATTLLANFGPHDWYNAALAPTGTLLAQRAGAVDAIQLPSGPVTPLIDYHVGSGATFSFAYFVVPDPDRKRYVVAKYDGFYSVAEDTGDRSFLCARTDLEFTPFGYASSNSKVYVYPTSEGSFGVLDLATGAYAPVAGTGIDGAHRVALDDAHGWLYVNSATTLYRQAITGGLAEQFAVLTSTPVESSDAIAYDGVADRIFLARDELHEISVLNHNRTVLASPSAGTGPLWGTATSMAFDVVNGALYVSGTSAIVRVDLATKVRTIVASPNREVALPGSAQMRDWQLAITADPTVLVATSHSSTLVALLDTTTGEFAVISR